MHVVGSHKKPPTVLSSPTADPGRRRAILVRVRRLVGIGLVALLVAAGVVALVQPRHAAERPPGRQLDPAARAGEGEAAEEQAREEIERYVEEHRGTRAAAAAEAPYPSKNTDGEAGSGGRAVAYRAGGVTVTAPEVTAQAPDALLFRTGFGSWSRRSGSPRRARSTWRRATATSTRGSPARRTTV